MYEPVFYGPQPAMSQSGIKNPFKIKNRSGDVVDVKFSIRKYFVSSLSLGIRCFTLHCPDMK